MGSAPGVLVVAVRIRVLSAATIGRDTSTKDRFRPKKVTYQGALRRLTGWIGGASRHEPAMDIASAFNPVIQRFVRGNSMMAQKIIGTEQELIENYGNLTIEWEYIDPRLIIVDPIDSHVTLLESGPVLRSQVDGETVYVETINSVYEVSPQIIRKKLTAASSNSRK